MPHLYVFHHLHPTVIAGCKKEWNFGMTAMHRNFNLLFLNHLFSAAQSIIQRLHNVIQYDNVNE